LLKPLIDAIANELERARPLIPQVIKHLASAHSVDRGDVESFLSTQVPTLEEYEIDLIFSPLFTPSLADQAVFAQRLGAGAVPRLQWAEIIEQLELRQTKAQLVTEDGKTHALLLRTVTLERFVHRLRLEATLPVTVFERIKTQVPTNEQGLALAIARRAIWESEGRRPILDRFVTAADWSQADTLADAVGLLHIVETYQPSDESALRQRLDHLLEVGRQEVSYAANPRPFFSQRIHEMHGGGRDQRARAESAVLAKEAEVRFLNRLKSRLI